MKISKFYLAPILYITSVTAFAGVVQHDNYVCAYQKGTSSKVIFSIDTSNYTAIITNGQPFGGVENVPTTSLKNPGCIVIFSGNKKSTQVAKWVKKQMEADNVKWIQRNMAASVTYKDNDNIPDELNVAIRGNITLEFRDPLNYTTTTYTCPNMIIAQGSTKVLIPVIVPPFVVVKPTNNLWMFSNTQNSEYRPNKTIFNCYDSSGKLQNMAMYRDYGSDTDIRLGLADES